MSAIRWLAVVCTYTGLVTAQSLPTGFVDVPVASGFTFPHSMGFLPDGRVVIGQQDGVILVVANGTVGSVGTVADAANGLLGIAVDPGWPTRPYVYVHYEHALTPFVHVARIEVTGDLASPTSTNLQLGSVFKLLIDIPVGLHLGGTVRFGPDGMLYVSTGDAGMSCTAQDLTAIGGRILRLDIGGIPAGGGGPPPKSALVAAGNPFPGPNENALLTWAIGLRNPFRFHIDSVSGSLFIADVGDLSFEEIDIAPSGGLNFGWPQFEGPLPAVNACPGGSGIPVTQPAAAIDRSGSLMQASVISLASYRSPPSAPAAFGPAYDGDYFFTDYFQGYIRRLKWTGTGWVTPPPVPGQPNAQDWATGVYFATDGAVGPDGALYYVARIQGQLRAIKPDPNANVLTVVGGDGQVGTSRQPLPDPISVRLEDASGVAIPNAPVTFATIPAGVGTLAPQPVLTNASGIATTTYTLGDEPAVIVATDSQNAAASVSFVWRGLAANLLSSAGQSSVTIELYHSATSSPFTLIAEQPTMITPLPFPAGAIWTTIISPGPSAIILDGLGLHGAPNPAYVTTAQFPYWAHTFPLPPQLTGQSFVVQGFGFDFAVPYPLGLLVTNPVVFTVP